MSTKENEIMRLMTHHVKWLIRSLDVLGDDLIGVGASTDYNHQRKCIQGIHVCVYKHLGTCNGSLCFECCVVVQI
jgi:hypothetical protein